MPKSRTILVAIITRKEWVTNRARLKHELFDRRYAIYEKITVFLTDVLQGHFPADRENEFLRQTKLAFFVFNCGPDIRNLIMEIDKHASHLRTLKSQINETNGNERTSMLKEEAEIRNWFIETLSSIEKKFEKYLQIEH